MARAMPRSETYRCSCAGRGTDRVGGRCPHLPVRRAATVVRRFRSLFRDSASSLRRAGATLRASGNASAVVERARAALRPLLLTTRVLQFASVCSIAFLARSDPLAYTRLITERSLVHSIRPAPCGLWIVQSQSACSTLAPEPACPIAIPYSIPWCRLLAGIAAILGLTLSRAFIRRTVPIRWLTICRDSSLGEQAACAFSPPRFNQTGQPRRNPHAPQLLLGRRPVVTFVQWLASVASIAGVSSISWVLGLAARKSVAALFCSTPSGILASSGAKNATGGDVAGGRGYFALRFLATHVSGCRAPRRRLRSGVLTKDAYLFAPWLWLRRSSAGASFRGSLRPAYWSSRRLALP